MFDDKWRFHGFCRAHALPVPPTLFVGAKADLDFDRLARELGLPFMVKPADCSGSLGVVTVRDRADLRAIQDDATYPDGALLAQQHVDGWDIDISLLAVHGRLRALACHRVAGCWIEFVADPVLEALAEAMCRRSGYHGVMNVDARIERATGRVLLIESNPRFWATLAAPTGCGLNFLAECVHASSSTADAPRRLAGGRFNQRHPLLQPGAWWTLLADGRERGRLLRASAFDPYSLGRLAADMPAMGSRGLRRAARFVGARVFSPPAA
jgi:predicted ATP-grasp superfamily ATP-dependent carboligase